jgi:membrane fusion protein, multidrug efflux system
METTQPRNGKKSKLIRAYIALALVLIGIGIYGWQWYRQYTSYYSTDDAYIDADKVSVSARIMGRIGRIYADEGDSVRQGMLLVELDSTDLTAQKIQSMAARDQAVAALQQAEAKYTLDQKGITVQEINLARAKEDLDRATAQLAGKVIAQEQYDHLKKTFESSQAQLEASKAQLEVSKSQVSMAASSIRTTDAQIGVIRASLQNTRIFAPASGRIARRWMLPGDVLQPGQPVYTITKDSLFYVMAYFEETKISGIHVGKKGKFTVDAFPGVTFFGSVINVGTNTAAQFSLIPPNNASGNFTKITQRIPVKISIDSTESKEKAVKFRLAAGMSVIIKIFK